MNPAKVFAFAAVACSWAAVGCGGSDHPGANEATDAGSLGDAAPPPQDEAREDADNAQDDALGWTGGQGDAGELQCAELAPLDVPTFADAKASPGTAFRMKVRVKVAPTAAVPLWLWQPTRVLPEPVTSLTPTGLDQGWTTVSFPLETPGTYRVLVHSHYPGTATCAADLVFTAQ